MARREASPDSAPPPASLIEISRLLEETARIVCRHADAERRPPPRSADAPPSPLEITAPLVRAILRIRRLRADYIPAATGDPAWTMILELYAAGLEGTPMNQSRLTLAAEVPHTTGLRMTPRAAAGSARGERAAERRRRCSAPFGCRRGRSCRRC